MTEGALATDLEFVSLGMLILDELEFRTHKLKDVLGGSGTYATLGARLFRSGVASRSIAWMVKTGDDLPSDTQALLESWNCTLKIESDSGRVTTRGRLSYKDDIGTKTFEYTTPVLQVTARDLEGTDLIACQSFHILSNPVELVEQVSSLIELRRKAGITSAPVISWEPRPSSCTPDNMQDFRKAVRYVTIFSPNHIELAQLFGHNKPACVAISEIEDFATSFLTSGVGPDGSGAVVIRADEQGCLIMSPTVQARWLPPYFGLLAESEEHKVEDPTGAGNTFLGAFTVCYVESRDLFQAGCYGNVGASFALEQIGVPSLQKFDTGSELWNGVSVLSRLNEYLAQLEHQGDRFAGESVSTS